MQIEMKNPTCREAAKIVAVFTVGEDVVLPTRMHSDDGNFSCFSTTVYIVTNNAEITQVQTVPVAKYFKTNLVF